ncbi:hypothetical protein [Mycobacterium sp. 852002-51057_SCH5723018]|uniref:hypothetical protein n=1 Tax=Mycobacterium sp. 852002-51057_SCH5723018 TaxID=1834094 RepID=UPI0007FD30AA|nr:hypothetical protein [Mycobacterium sp. 852002-51057_SCH5723018]OBG27589.1 hypothetical protein A5764_03310 [Mycobacterium sp. 852002-51057_SCH5723018]
MSNRSRPAGIAATIVLLIVHGFLFGATVALLGLLVMGTDPCGSVKCGDPVWIDRAMRLGVWGGAVVLVADVGVAVYLLIRRKLAFVAPIVGCLAQVGLAIGAAAMESLAGPV